MRNVICGWLVYGWPPIIDLPLKAIFVIGGIFLLFGFIKGSHQKKMIGVMLMTFGISTYMVLVISINVLVIIAHGCIIE